MECTQSKCHMWPIFVIVAVIAAAVISVSIYSRGQTGALKEDSSNTSASTASRIGHVNEADFKEKVLLSKVPVLVEFYADWCPPCKALAPVLEELAGEITDAKIVKVNADENIELSRRFNVTTIPRLYVFKNGEMTNRHEGLADKATLRKILYTDF
jgi:thioredoxin 1